MGAQYLLPVGISSQEPGGEPVPLLRVVGFDAANQRYRYTVNETAGALPKAGIRTRCKWGAAWVPSSTGTPT
ncbi:MAG: hypothetical protein IPK33_00305 [Gemmatimonadetes bacterium]|nr:hypothetical protein [Gemmatimonadota bacterium]